MIAILGRGSSLSKYVYHYQLIDKIYIVNNFNKEIDILGIDKFKGKEIINVMGRGPNELTLSNYKQLNVKHVQFNRMDISEIKNKSKIPVPIKPLPSSLLKKGFPPLDWNIYLDNKDKFENCEDMCQHIETEFSKKIRKNIRKSKCHRAWPTTGILAIDLAIEENEVEELYLFGFDLYSDHYMIKKNSDYQNKDWDKSKMMLFYIENICKKYDFIRFYNSSKVSLSENNWINI